MIPGAGSASPNFKIHFLISKLWLGDIICGMNVALSLRGGEWPIERMRVGNKVLLSLDLTGDDPFYLRPTYPFDSEPTHDEWIEIVEFCRTYRVNVLLLRHNVITHLPNEFACLTELRMINLAMNKLDRVPLVLAHLTSLKIVNLTGNKCLDKVKAYDQEFSDILLDRMRTQRIVTYCKAKLLKIDTLRAITDALPMPIAEEMTSHIQLLPFFDAERLFSKDATIPHAKRQRVKEHE